MTTVTLGWVAMPEREGDYHLLPVGDLRWHGQKDCWCHPTRDEEEPSIYVHHAADRREHTIEAGHPPH